MKKFNLFILTLFISNVFSQDISNKYAETITSEELKSLLYVYASDSFEGREAGTKGEILAVEFIRDFYLKNDIKPAKGTEDYFQKMEITTPQRISLPDKIPDSVRTFMQNGDMEKLRNYAMVAGVRTGGEKLNSINVASIIEGSHYPNEYIVITAHLDHVGIEGEGWPRLDYKASNGCGINYLPEYVNKKYTDNSSIQTNNHKKWPEPTTVNLKKGDMCIINYLLPHTRTNNINGIEDRINVFFRLRNKKRQPNIILNGVSDSPDRGFCGTWINYEDGNDPWEKSKYAMCNIWEEFEGINPSELI